ncbi:MAG: glycyl radical protein [Chloroflexi bacterium]|nr:MAG: glycyl radical protein [Chloroflexota bacterium]
MATIGEQRTTLRVKEEMPFLLKATRAYRAKVGEEAPRTPYRPGIKICMERPRLFTESFKQTEGEPMVLRRAKALANYLDKMTIYIQPWERIVGNFASDPNKIQHYPELFVRWIDRAIDDQYKDLLDDDERAELHEIHKYWTNLAVHGAERALLPEDVRPYCHFMNHRVFTWLHGGRTGVPNYEKLFRLGLRGIIQEAKDRLAQMSSDPDFYIHADKYLPQKHFLDAVIISLEAGCRWGKRYAQLARELAENEKDEKRKKELEEIAEVCDWVPENPPRTFHEALQSWYFVMLITKVIDLQSPGLGERFDQIMYPFYKKDKEEGRITREEAQELVEHAWLKMNEFGELVPPMRGGGGGGGGMVVTARVTTIGGQTRDGDDATNEMTYIVMDATNAIKLTHPAVAIRLHKNTPTEFLHALCDTLRQASGVYSLFNDEMMIPHLTSLGIPLEDARDYSTEGCMRWIIPGKAMGFRALGGMFMLPRCLELALSQGVDKASGKQIGARTPDPLTFTSIEDVIDAYLTQVKFFAQKLVTINNFVEVLDNEYLPQPFLSALMDGCIEHGQDCRHYKYFANTIFQPIGQVTVVNSLAAIKKLVFEDKKVSMAELLDALNNNWEGKEDLRQMAINEVPKFGNDDDYVDMLARDVYLRTTQTIRSLKNIYGGPFMEDGTGAATYYVGGVVTGATPDGRKAGENYNDGTCSPYPGTDKKGPTAVLKSVAKIDHARTFTHLFNQKFSPQFLEGANRDAFVSYLRTWVDLGIHHIQFNIIDRETLLDAQRHPEKYANLVVRVAGYSAYFVDLDKGLQDQIIARTEQGF